jgi:ferric-dicitrate binding protein FerR (iron transport regulator)
MKEQRLTYLLERYQADAATTEELQELSIMLKVDADSDLFKTVLAEMMRKEAPVFPGNRERWRKMALDIVDIDKRNAEPVVTSKTRVVRMFPWLAAAAMVLLIVLGGYLWMNFSHSSSLKESVISTATGEQREIVLPDGSHVWLNSASSIRWTVPFNEKERSVELSGEAFFDVQHADKIPFLIHSGAITTTVLGTSFDVTAYPNQKNIIVSVQSGKVKVQAGSRVLAVLEKGRQATVNADTISYQKDIDPLAIAVWRAGNLVYKDETLEDIVTDLQRTFKDSVVIKNASLKGTMITISLNRRMGMRYALEMICRTTDSRLSYKNGIFTIE